MVYNPDLYREPPPPPIIINPHSEPFNPVVTVTEGSRSGRTYEEIVQAAQVSQGGGTDIQLIAAQRGAPAKQAEINAQRGAPAKQAEINTQIAEVKKQEKLQQEATYQERRISQGKERPAETAARLAQSVGSGESKFQRLAEQRRQEELVKSGEEAYSAHVVQNFFNTEDSTVKTSAQVYGERKKDIEPIREIKFEGPKEITEYVLPEDIAAGVRESNLKVGQQTIPSQAKPPEIFTKRSVINVAEPFYGKQIINAPPQILQSPLFKNVFVEGANEIVYPIGDSIREIKGSGFEGLKDIDTSRGSFITLKSFKEQYPKTYETTTSFITFAPIAIAAATLGIGGTILLGEGITAVRTIRGENPISAGIKTATQFGIFNVVGKSIGSVKKSYLKSVGPFVRDYNQPTEILIRPVSEIGESPIRVMQREIPFVTNKVEPYYPQIQTYALKLESGKVVASVVGLKEGQQKFLNIFTAPTVLKKTLNHVEVEVGRPPLNVVAPEKQLTLREVKPSKGFKPEEIIPKTIIEVRITRLSPDYAKNKIIYSDLGLFPEKNIVIRTPQQFDIIRANVLKRIGSQSSGETYFSIIKEKIFGSKIEPQVSEAVRVLRQKGYAPYSSGFYGIKGGGGLGDSIKVGKQQIDVKGLFPSNTIKFAKELGANVNVNQQYETSSLFISQKGRSLSEVSDIFARIVKTLPNRNVVISKIISEPFKPDVELRSKLNEIAKLKVTPSRPTTLKQFGFEDVIRPTPKNIMALKKISKPFNLAKDNISKPLKEYKNIDIPRSQTLEPPKIKSTELKAKDLFGGDVKFQEPTLVKQPSLITKEGKGKDVFFEGEFPIFAPEFGRDKERIRMEGITKVRQRQEPRVNIAFGSRTDLSNLQMLESKSIQRPRIEQGLNIIEISKPRVREKERQIIMPIIKTESIITPITFQDIRQRPRQKIDIIEEPIPPEEPTKLMLRLDLEGSPFLKKQVGYDAYVVEKGRDVKVNKKPLPRTNALNLGFEAADNTPSRTVKLKKSGLTEEIESSLNFSLFDKFRKKSENTFVEKTTYAIDTEGELQGITVKGWLANKMKSNLGVNFSKLF